MGTASKTFGGNQEERSAGQQRRRPNMHNSHESGGNQSSPSDSPPRTHRKKRVLPPPSTPLSFIQEVGMATVRAYMLLPTAHRALVYMVIVAVGSLCGNMHLPVFYLMEKHNLFNQLFAKWSLAWTLVVLSPFVYFTSRVYSGDTTRNIRQQLARLIVAIILWFVCTTFFNKVQYVTASCSLAEHRSMKSCEADEGEWRVGFDISGHAFLLVYLCLIIVEECKVMRNWDNMSYMLELEDDSVELMHLGEGKADASRELHKELTPVIKTLFSLLAVVTVLWEVQLVITLLYYHTMLHKILGGLCALLCWTLTYRGWYTVPISPGMPGHGPLAYSAWRRTKK